MSEPFLPPAMSAALDLWRDLSGPGHAEISAFFSAISAERAGLMGRMFFGVAESTGEVTFNFVGTAAADALAVDMRYGHRRVPCMDMRLDHLIARLSFDRGPVLVACGGACDLKILIFPVSAMTGGDGFLGLYQQDGQTCRTGLPPEITALGAPDRRRFYTG